MRGLRFDYRFIAILLLLIVLLWVNANIIQPFSAIGSEKATYILGMSPGIG